ncbi:hypothetical protein D9758_009626 [Tetrapyrgos nigripes]|uniref:FAD-binding FR-type domain-containing protein n=1 Tax=Tetrapyrgos nigripes TaxID=182062 RepID=A0A8H5GCV9_9AGAR|nr:hypothetical protein D9758_009626 [Tetrapyrgos nigripes]
MTDHGEPPSIPTEFELYNSYVEDPKWQRKFSIIWASLVAGAVLYSLPHLIKALWQGKAFVGFWGLREEWNIDEADGAGTTTANRERRNATRGSSLWNKLQGLFLVFRSMFLWTLPGLRLNLGQFIIIVVYLVVVLLCLTTGAQLASNSNRAGFLALAQLPPLYLFATKNSVLAFLLGPGHSYHTLNPLHRLVGFNLILLAFIHGSLWISNHLTYNLPILSQQKEGSGVAALACLGILAVSSVQFIREGSIFKLFGRLVRLLGAGPLVTRVGWVCDTLSGLAYEWFWVTHLLVSTAFFITLCYHTSFAPPWIFPPLAFLGADLFMRMARMRMKDAGVWAVGKEMSVIRIPDTTSGWAAGQHVRLRVFFGGGRVLESHPLTIMNAPRDTSCLSLPGNEDLGWGTEGPGILLGARVSGDWTKALFEYVLNEREHIAQIQAEDAVDAEAEAGADVEKEKPFSSSGPQAKVTLAQPNTLAFSTSNEIAPALRSWGLPIPTLVSIDGPYGGSAIDLSEYETVLLIAGGSGATFTIGMLDELVGRCVRGRKAGEVTKRIEFVWCIRGFGCISWFTPILRSIALAAASTHSSSNPLHLHISIYVTCLCSPESAPDIPNMDVTVASRPYVGQILRGILSTSPSSNKVSPDMLPIPKDGLAKETKKDATSCASTPAAANSETNSIVETPRPTPTPMSNRTSASSSSDDLDKGKNDVEVDLEWGPHIVLPCKLPHIPLGGGVGVCASGPESLTRETSNAVARLGVMGGGNGLGLGGLGKVGVHTEVFRI